MVIPSDDYHSMSTLGLSICHTLFWGDLGGGGKRLRTQVVYRDKQMN